MIGKTLIAALVLLTLLSTVFGAIINNSVEPQIAESAPIEMSAQTASISCINPTSAAASATCTNIESEILAVTVRIELHTWANFGGHQKAITTKSHATILDGKYLVTHNHYKYSLTEQVIEFGEQMGYSGISIRTTSDHLLLENAPLATYDILHADAQTLVLAFIDENGSGLFESAGLSSAQFSDWTSIDWEESMELAQIDWDGESAHIDWVNVENLSLDDEVPQLQVNNFPKKGCSGGGVFWNGIHVGNNWAKNIEEDQDTDEITRRYSIIALNSSFIRNLDQ